MTLARLEAKVQLKPECGSEPLGGGADVKAGEGVKGVGESVVWCGLKHTTPRVNSEKKINKEGE